jgi:hypothetical protein
VNPVEVEDGDSAELAHGDGELHVDHAVHGRTPDRDREVEAVAHRKRDVDFLGVEGDAARHKCDFVESVGAARPPPDADLEARLLPGYCSAGFEPALIQAVFTPMVAGFGELYGMQVTST